MSVRLRSFRPPPGAGPGGEPEADSVEVVLEQGLRLAESSPVHLAFRGTAAADSVRCEWRGVARTAAQREASIRYWLGLDDTIVLPDADAIERLFIAIIERAEPSYPESARASFRALARGGVTDQYRVPRLLRRLHSQRVHPRGRANEAHRCLRSPRRNQVL